MYLLKFTVLCFGSEFAFDLLDESETANWVRNYAAAAETLLKCRRNGVYHRN
jgi:hypothetical protein